MALVVEDGTGLSGAQVYASVSDFTTFMSSLGHDLSAFSEEDDLEPAMLRAMEFLETHYSWIGSKLTREQALAWPRSVRQVDRDGFEYDPVPGNLKKALYWMALEAIYGSLYPEGQSAAPDVSPGTGEAVLPAPLKRFRRKVGPMEREWEYNIGGSGQTGELRSNPRVDALLEDLVSDSGDVLRA